MSAAADTPGGTHTVWMRGRSFRDDEVLVDGKRVGVAHEINGPQAWINVGRVTLRAGPHTVEVRRPGWRLAPGERQADSIGPVVLVPDGPVAARAQRAR